MTSKHRYTVAFTDGTRAKFAARNIAHARAIASTYALAYGLTVKGITR